MRNRIILVSISCSLLLLVVCLIAWKVYNDVVAVRSECRRQPSESSLGDQTTAEQARVVDFTQETDSDQRLSAENSGARPCTVEGYVLDENGRGVVEANIFALMGDFSTAGTREKWEPYWEEIGVRTDADGTFRFRIPHVCPKGVAAVTSDLKQYGECRLGPALGAVVACVIQPAESWALHGSVVDSDRTPIAGARVSITPSWNYQLFQAIFSSETSDVENMHQADFHALWSKYTWTGEHGDFTINFVPEDTWIVMIEAIGSQRLFFEVPLNDLMEEIPQNYVVEEKDCWDVLVVDEEGTAVAGVSVEVLPIAHREFFSSFIGMTNEGGMVEICDISSSNASIIVSTQGDVLLITSSVIGLDLVEVTVSNERF